MKCGITRGIAREVLRRGQHVNQELTKPENDPYSHRMNKRCLILLVGKIDDHRHNVNIAFSVNNHLIK